MAINEVQDEIINEFSLLDGDAEMTVFYIMELGQKIPVMKEADKTEDNIVKGREFSTAGLSGMEKHKQQLKMLFFNPGKKIIISLGMDGNNSQAFKGIIVSSR